MRYTLQQRCLYYLHVGIEPARGKAPHVALRDVLQRDGHDEDVGYFGVDGVKCVLGYRKSSMLLEIDVRL